MSGKIYFPQNIFTKLIKYSFNEEIASQVSFQPSSLLTGEILKTPDSVGLIPTLDLIRHKEFFVSKSFGISFEESLCNSYLYFQTHGKDIKELNLVGDVTSNEVIGGKLIMKELYGIDVQINLLTGNKKQGNRNILAVGDINFEDDKYLSGISFAEEIIEVLTSPYVNFVLVSTEQTAIENFHKSINDVQSKIYSQVENGKFGINLSESSGQMFRENISSFICNLDEQDMDGIDQLLRLAFYHEIIPEIVQIKFV